MQQRNMPSRTSLVTSQLPQGMGRSRIQSLQGRDVDDMPSQHTSMFHEEASNRAGMLKSSTTILASWSLEESENCMGHLLMLEDMNRIYAAEEMWEYSVKIHNNLHLRVVLMQPTGARKGNLYHKKNTKSVQIQQTF